MGVYGEWQNNLISEANKYLSYGATVLPAQEKRILITDWSKLQGEQVFEDQYTKFWKTATGLGFLCGAVNMVICVDIDLDMVRDEALIAEITARLPPILSGKIGNPNRRPSQFFKFNGEINRKYKNIGVEILSTGSQTIIPPSKHPDFNKQYEWVGTPLYNLSDVDDLPILPPEFLDWLEAKNQELKPGGKIHNEQAVSVKGNGRCNHNSHNIISALGVALIHDNYPFDRLVKRVIDKDRKLNHDAEYLYFECPTRKWRHKTVDENAKDFVEEIYKRHGPQGNEPPPQEANPEEEQTVNKNEIELITLKDLLESPDEHVQYVVENLLPHGGTSIVAAKPKCGKTTLLRQLALCVAKGHLFLNRMCSRGPVIYFSVEEKIDEIKSHFKAMGANGDEEIYIFASRAPKDTLEKLKPIINQIQPSLIILDTLFKIVRMKDANDYASISAALEPIQELARESGAHILCVHHAGKADRDGADGILGSTAILAAFDTAIIMNRSNDKRTIKSIQRYGTDLEESTLIFDKETRCSDLGQENWRVKAEERGKEVMEFVANAGTKVSLSEIKLATGIDQKLLLKTIKSLINTKTLCVFGRGTKGDPLMYSNRLF